MGTFGSGRGSLNSWYFGIDSVMLAQLAGLYFSSICTAKNKQAITSLSVIRYRNQYKASLRTNKITHGR